MQSLLSLRTVKAAPADSAPASTTPANPSSLALVTENPYAYRAGLAKHEILDLVIVAFALAIIGVVLIFHEKLERIMRPVFARVRTFRQARS